MIRTLPQQKAPEAGGRETNRQNVFYPQAFVTLSVIFENFGDPANPTVFPVSPRSITVYGNSFKEADTFSLSFDAQDMPVSPNLVRGGAAEIYIFQTQGIGQRPQVVRAQDDPSTPQLEGLEPSIVGLFKNVDLQMDSSGRIITISGMDYTQLFLNRDWDPRRSGNGGRIPTGLPLAAIIQQLMNEVPSAEVMRLRVDPIDSPQPIVGAAEARTNKRGLPVNGQSNYWDVMYDLAVRYGFILYVDGLDVVLAELEGFARARRANVRKMAYGRNLLSLRLERQMGREQVPTIECRSYDESTRRVVRGRFPPNLAETNRIRRTGLNAVNEEVQVIPVPGVRSEEQLRNYAKQIFYIRSRSEQRVKLSTMDLRDLEGNDLIELGVGDAMSIGFDAFNRDSVIIEGMAVEQRTEALVRLGYDRAVASTISESFDEFNVFKQPFRVRDYTLEWDYQSGLTISADLQNFVNIKGLEP